MKANLLGSQKSNLPKCTYTRQIGSNGRVARVVCSAADPDRRQVLTGIAGGMALSVGTQLVVPDIAEAKMVDKVIKGSALSAFQRRDLLADFQVMWILLLHLGRVMYE